MPVPANKSSTRKFSTPCKILNRLDPYNRRVVINTIRELPQTKLITSHDLDMILDTCERVILLSNGRIAADGPAEELLRDRALLEANRMELPLSLMGRE